MNVLIMGGTRFNGPPLVEMLLASGNDVTVLTRGRSAQSLPSGVGHLVADRTDSNQLRDVLAPCAFDCVFDLTAYLVEHVRSLLDALRGRIGRYLFVSSASVYAPKSILPIREDDPVMRGPTSHSYCVNKLSCEDYLLELYATSSFPVSIVRFPMVIGPNNYFPDREQRMFKRLLLGRSILVPGRGKTVNQVCHVADCASALAALSRAGTQTFGNVYNVSSHDSWTDDGYVDAFARAVGVAPKRVYVPPAMMETLGEEPARGPTVAASQPRLPVQRLYPPQGRAWDDSVVFSTAKLMAHTDWTPRFGFADAVADTFAWFERQPTADESFDFSWEDAILAALNG